MEGYGIRVHTARGGTNRYRVGSESLGGQTEAWGLIEAEKIAHRLLQTWSALYVTFGNGDHEFRMWAEYVTSFRSFDHPGVRWADWYVDVEIGGHRWRYRPVADLDDYEAANALSGRAATLHPHVTRVWVGASDGSEQYEHETRDS